MKTIKGNEKLDFTGESIYAGIDVHKKQWNVTIMSALNDQKRHCIDIYIFLEKSIWLIK